MQQLGDYILFKANKFSGRASSRRAAGGFTASRSFKWAIFAGKEGATFIFTDKSPGIVYRQTVQKKSVFLHDLTSLFAEILVFSCFHSAVRVRLLVVNQPISADFSGGFKAAANAQSAAANAQAAAQSAQEAQTAQQAANQAREQATAAAGSADAAAESARQAAEAAASAQTVVVAYVIDVPTTGWADGSLTWGGATYTRTCTVMAEQATASPTSVSMSYEGGDYDAYCQVGLIDTQAGSVVLWASADPTAECQIKIVEVRSNGKS